MSFSKEQLAEFKEAFSLFDFDHDGNITGKEIGVAIRSLGRHPTEAEVDELVKEFDADGSTLINFDTFLKIMGKKDSTVTSQEILESFKVFDLDGNGYITASELHEVMYSLAGMSDKVSKEEIDEMIRETDLDEDGRINYKEFAKVVTKA